MHTWWRSLKEERDCLVQTAHPRVLTYGGWRALISHGGLLTWFFSLSEQICFRFDRCSVQTSCEGFRKGSGLTCRAPLLVDTHASLHRSILENTEWREVWTVTGTTAGLLSPHGLWRCWDDVNRRPRRREDDDGPTLTWTLSYDSRGGRDVGRGHFKV